MYLGKNDYICMLENNWLLLLLAVSREVCLEISVEELYLI